MKLTALFWMSRALVIAEAIRFDLFAQESAAVGRKGLNPPRDKHHLVFQVQKRNCSGWAWVTTSPRS